MMGSYEDHDVYDIKYHDTLHLFTKMTPEAKFVYWTDTQTHVYLCKQASQTQVSKNQRK